MVKYLNYIKTVGTLLRQFILRTLLKHGCLLENTDYIENN